MNVSVEKLRAFGKENNINFEAMAKMMGIDGATFYRKLKCGVQKFTIGEVNRLVDAAGMSRDEALAIFFSDNSQ